MGRASRGLLIRVLVLMGLLIAILPGATLAQGASVVVQPPAQNVGVGGTATVNVRVEGVTDLYGAEVHLTFSPSVLQAADADGDASNGVQVATGNIFSGKNAFNAVNSVNNSTGTIDYAISLLGEPAGVTGSGTLFSVTFQGQSQGLSAIAYVTVLLASRTGGQITATTVNGTVTVTSGQAPTDTPTPTATTPSASPTTPVASPTTPVATATPTSTTVPGGFNCTYVVRFGDTLYSIANRFGTTVSALASVNGIANPNVIFVGRTLLVPCVATVTPTATKTVTVQPGCPGFVYTVASGDTLTGIARRFGTTVNAILSVNFIPNPNVIFVGQKICVPGQQGPTITPVPGCRAFYTIKPGDTLIGIAAKYGTTYWSIAIANNISNPNLIFVGMTLCIP